MLRNTGNFSGNERYEGFCIDLLREIAQMVGFTYRIELVPDGKYGVYNYETKEWNGIVRDNNRIMYFINIHYHFIYLFLFFFLLSFIGT